MYHLCTVHPRYSEQFILKIRLQITNMIYLYSLESTGLIAYSFFQSFHNFKVINKRINNNIANSIFNCSRTVITLDNLKLMLALFDESIHTTLDLSQ